MKNKWLGTCLVPVYVDFCLCTTEQMYKDRMKSLKCKDINEWADRSNSAWCQIMNHVDNGTKVAVVSLRADSVKDAIEAYAILVHEAVHVWQETKEYIAEEKPSYEFEAISIEHIAENLMREYDRQIKLADKQ